MILKESQPSMKELVQLMESASTIKFQPFITEEALYEELRSKDYDKLYENLEPSLKKDLDAKIDEFFDTVVYDTLIEHAIEEHQKELLLEFGSVKITPDDVKRGLKGLNDKVKNSEALKQLSIHMRKAMTYLKGPLMRRMMGAMILAVHKYKWEPVKFLLNCPRYFYMMIFGLTFGLLGKFLTKAGVAATALGTAIGVPYLYTLFSSTVGPSATKSTMDAVKDIVTDAEPNAPIQNMLNAVETTGELGVELATGKDQEWGLTDKFSQFTDKVGNKVADFFNRGGGETTTADVPEQLKDPTVWEKTVEMLKMWEANPDGVLRSPENTWIADRGIDGLELLINYWGWLLEKGGQATQMGIGSLKTHWPMIDEYCRSMGYGNILIAALTLFAVGAVHQGVKNTIETGLPWRRKPGYLNKVSKKMQKDTMKDLQPFIDQAVKDAMAKELAKVNQGPQQQQPETGKTQ